MALVRPRGLVAACHSPSRTACLAEVDQRAVVHLAVLVAAVAGVGDDATARAVALAQVRTLGVGVGQADEAVPRGEALPAITLVDVEARHAIRVGAEDPELLTALLAEGVSALDAVQAGAAPPHVRGEAPPLLPIPRPLSRPVLPAVLSALLPAVVLPIGTARAVIAGGVGRGVGAEESRATTEVVETASL